MPPFERKPEWLKIKAVAGPNFRKVKGLLRELDLHTVCEEASCPNAFECFESGTATFLILGDRCTRNCSFCNVRPEKPLPTDPQEPERVAAAAGRLGLHHVVVTSVTRDDLPDGGAGLFAETVRAIRRQAPQAAVEVLIPDFQGDEEALLTVVEAGPDILGHNIETVPRLYPGVRRGADYHRSMALLAQAAEWTSGSSSRTKSGIMLGLGEREKEVRAVLEDLRRARCEMITLGQYLRPSLRHLPVVRYVPPEEFSHLKQAAMNLGFGHVEAGPLVRSSYHAAEQSASF